MITALGTVTIAYLTQALSTPAQASISPTLFWSLLVGSVLGLTALGLQRWADYRKLTYDPTWVLKFMEIFDSTAMKKTRAGAAKEIKSSAGKVGSPDFPASDLDNVLNFFEDLGFYLHGDQLTPEVAHHAFHHWVRGYYCAARDYIELEKGKERTNWEYIKYLFDILNEIEAERMKAKPQIVLDESGLTEFLNSEITNG